MSLYDISTYGERYAGVYDEWFGAYPEATVAVLSEMACGGRALELGIGAGRVALALAAMGVGVHGIDASPTVVDKLREKPGGDQIPMVLRDFADVGVEGTFSLIYVIRNTFTALLSQEEQVRCFRNIARHLTPEGHFVVETFVPDLRLYAVRQTIRASRVDPEFVSLHVARFDPVRQRVTGQQVTIRDGGVGLYPIQLRYVWPAEQDLMAQMTGMRLRQRWGSWARDEFTARSEKHISVYAPAGGPSAEGPLSSSRSPVRAARPCRL